MSVPFILYRRAVCIIRGVRREGAVQYWTGGDPHISVFITDAYRFTTYASALECAGTHKLLRDSDEWRVARADGRSPVGTKKFQATA